MNAAIEASKSGVAVAATADVAVAEEASVSVADSRRLVKGAVSGQFRKGQDAVAEVEATEEYIELELGKELAVRDAISERLADTSDGGIIPRFVRKVNEVHEGVQHSERKITELTKEDDDKLIKHFGKTGNYEVAGYMLKNGVMLDFSGKHWGDTTSRTRQVDHRDIWEVWSNPDKDGTDEMVNMIGNGNIRLMPETGGINLAVAPSKNQRVVLRRYIEWMSRREGVIVDIDEVGGDTIKSFEYDKGVSADRVMRDIDNYFKGAVTSDLMQFHTMGDGIQFSEKNGDIKKAEELSETDFRFLLEQTQYGVLDDDTYIPMRISTPEFFRDVVFEHSKGKITVMDVPLASQVEHVRQNMEEEDNASYGNARPHELSIDDVVSISKEMGHPSYIVLQKNGRYAMIVSFYSDKSRKRVIASIDFARDKKPTNNYKYRQYMNGYNEGYYNIIVTQYQPDSFDSYLDECEIIYDKKKMNGKYQVGSGRVVTFTHDTPFIDDSLSHPDGENNGKIVNNEGVQFSEKDTITQADIDALRSIGKKSVNAFTSEDIKKAEPFARRMFKDLGVKSPFFRAWFGDWRASDGSPVEPVRFAYGENGKINYKKRNVKCVDMDSIILIDDNVVEDSIHYAKINGDEKQIRKLLSKVDEILANGVLLDTKVSTKTSGNKKGSTQFMHYLYTPILINDAPFVAKLAVEEYDIDGKRRAYNLQRIEMSELSRAQFQQIMHEDREKYAYSSDAISISSLFNLVKTYDEEFNPKEASKIVNPDGTPKVMYHGSTARFTVFDKNKAKSSGAYGSGFYFTDSDSHAKQYGNLYAVYLDVKNPLKQGEAKVTESQIRKFLEAVAENEDDYSIENYGTYDISEILKKIESRDAFSVIFDINTTSIGDMVEAVKLWNKVNGTSFDGIVAPTETVVFEPTQIKSATDNIGTFDGGNEDIQYSEKVTDFTHDDYNHNCKELVRMDYVANLNGTELDGDAPLKSKLSDLFASWGGVIKTNIFGNVEVSNASIRSEIRHGSTRNKITAYAAIPNVLKNGVIIDTYKKNNGEVERIIVAAPIKITDMPFFMGVMLQRDSNTNRLYLHDVVIKKEASDYQTQHLNTTGAVDTENLFISEVLEKAISDGYILLQNSQEINDGIVNNEGVQFSEKDYSYENLSASDYYENGKIYSYDFLVAQKNMAGVQLPKTGTLTNEKGKIDDNKIVDLGIKNALSVGTKRGNKVYVENDYTKRELRIDISTIKHGLDGTYNRHLTNARIGSVIGSIVKNAIPINGLKNSSDIAVGTYAMASYCYDDQGREFIAIVTVEQQSGNVEGIETYDVAHAVSGRQKKSSQVDTKSQGVYPIKATDISISHLIEIVNSTHQSILSNDVLEHLGEQRNPKGSYSDKVLFSEKDTGTSAYDIMGEKKALERRYKILEKDFARLKEMYKLDKRLTHGKVLDMKQVAAVARYLVKFADSDYKASELAPILNDLYVDLREMVTDNPDATWDMLYSKAYEVAKEIRTKAKVKVERPAYYIPSLYELLFSPKSNYTFCQNIPNRRFSKKSQIPLVFVEKRCIILFRTKNNSKEA